MKSGIGAATAAGLIAAAGLTVLVAPAAPRPAAAAAAAPATASYAIPQGAIFVSPTGDDSAAGTQDKPLRTAAAALRRAKSGDTIVFRGGEYRESLGVVGKRVTLQAYPGETVWFKGSTVVPASKFVRDGNAWRLDGWDPPICRPGPDLTGCIQPADITKGNEIAGDPAMAFLDGTPLTQVASRAELTAGTFYRDVAAKRLYLGSDPTGRKVELSSIEYALHFVSGAENSVVRGLGFTHYANAQDYSRKPAVLISQAKGVVFEGNTVTRNAGAGLGVHAADNRVTGNLIEANGFNGVLSHRASGLILEGNRIIANNQERIGLESVTSLAGAGMKATFLRDSVIRDNIFQGNQGAGFWCDLSCHGITIVRNLAVDNTKSGIYYEVSANGLIASNVMARNGQYGLKISGSNKVRVYNNTLAENAQAIMIVEDPRPDTRNCTSDTCPSSADRALGITWDTREVTLFNNLFSGGASTAPLFDTLDGNSASSGKRVGASGMISQMDYNAYHRSKAGVPAVLVRWVERDGSTTSHTTLSTLVASGREQNGRYQEATAIFASKTTYAPAKNSPLATGGKPLPADVAQAIGVTAGVPVAIGALRWPAEQAPAPVATASPRPSPALSLAATQPAVSPRPGTAASRPSATAPVTIPSPQVTARPVPSPGATSGTGGTGGTTSGAARLLTKPVYWLERPDTGHSLLTLNAAEQRNATDRYGYRPLGVGGYVAGIPGHGLVPVYRLRSTVTGDRLFTRSAAERDNVLRLGYVSEGIAFYAAASSGDGLVPVYRLRKGAYHRYVVGAAARDAAQRRGWLLEHVAFHVRPHR